MGDCSEKLQASKNKKKKGKTPKKKEGLPLARLPVACG
jgi:hypothetical protein